MLFGIQFSALCRPIGRVLINSIYLCKSLTGLLPSCRKGIFSFEGEKSILCDRLDCHCEHWGCVCPLNSCHFVIDFLLMTSRPAPVEACVQVRIAGNSSKVLLSPPNNSVKINLVLAEMRTLIRLTIHNVNWGLLNGTHRKPFHLLWPGYNRNAGSLLIAADYNLGSDDGSIRLHTHTPVSTVQLSIEHYQFNQFTSCSGVFKQEYLARTIESININNRFLIRNCISFQVN